MKPHIFVAAVLYVSALASCMHHKHTTIATTTNGQYQKLEFSGLVNFSQIEEGSVSMSPHSWLKYKENGLQLNIDCNESGQLSYKLNGTDKTSRPTVEEKSVLVRAAKLVAQYSPKRSNS